MDVGSDAQEISVTTRKQTRLACFLAATLGLVFTVACFFPGYMSPDSVLALWQGRMMNFSDWHPPVMSLLWGILDRIAPGPAGMLILHNFIFWAGLSLFVYHLGFERVWAAMAILLTGLAPPVFALLSTIWKDVSMACSFLLACGLLLQADRKHSKLAWAVALFLLWYGLSARHNAIVAVIPLAVWAAVISCQLFPSKGRRPTLVVALLRASLLVVLLVATVTGVTRALTKGRTAYPIQQILVHDLAGVSLETNTLDLPEYLVAALRSKEVSSLNRLYTPDSVVPLFCCDSDGRFEITTDRAKFTRLWKKWLSVIPRHWGAYINHRTKIFKSEFTIGRTTVCLPFWDGIDQNPLNVVFQPTVLNRAIMRALSRVKDGPLFWGWLYLVLLGILLSMFWLGSSQERVAALLIGLSGLLYALAYFFVCTTCDFRMHWWSVLTVFLLLLLQTASRLKAARSRA